MAPKTAPKAAPAPKTAPKASGSKPKAPPAPAKKAAPAPKAAVKAPAPKAAAPRATGSSANGVYVKNWGNGSVEDAIRVFEQAGAVQGARIRRHRYALVYFDSPNAVKKAIDLFNDKVVLQQKVTVLPARSGPKADPKEASATVFVSPIFRASTTKEQISSLFDGYKVLLLRAYRQNYVYAFLDSHASAEKFQKEMNGKMFRNHKLRVELSAKSLEKVKAHQTHSTLLIEAHRQHKKAHNVQA